MERGLMMVLHAILIALVLYLFMVYILKCSPYVAEDKSVLIGSIVLFYMVLFGHGLPTHVNRNILS
jgi:hypothetical protein